LGGEGGRTFTTKATKTGRAEDQKNGEDGDGMRTRASALLRNGNGEGGKA